MSGWIEREDRGWIIDPGYWNSSNGHKDIDASNHISRRTGLLDHLGREIHKEPNPIGFGRPQGKYSIKD